MMLYVVRILLPIVIALGVQGVLSAQSERQKLTSYVRNVNAFSRLYPQEKVWLHFDNTGYYIGETIWFKAYVVGAAYHDTTFFSKVLHVELLTAEGYLVDSRKLKIEHGQCHGEFRLDKEYRSGFYEVRAYTRNQLNFEEDSFFSRVFPVYRSPKATGDYAERKMDPSGVLYPQRRQSDKPDRINLSFYPEGGNAVLGLRSRIAFKATGDEGQDLDVTGVVYNETNDAVTSFSSSHQGMGFFELTPTTTEYKVIVEGDGRKRTFIFNKIEPLGIVMQVEQPDDTTYRLRLEKSRGLSTDVVGFSVSCRGVVCTAETIQLGDTALVFPLGKSAFPAGCLQFTLFDKQGQVLSERLVFNPGKRDHLRVSYSQDKTIYKPLERVNMAFQVRDAAGTPVRTNFSLAIRDAGTELRTGYQDNILTDLLLSSDVRGYIENPMQYFTGCDSVSRLNLDLLMLVQGWRRYNWPLMAGVQPFHPKYYVEEGLDISGRVVDYWKNEKSLTGDVRYWMLKGDVFHGKYTTDASGRFHFTLPDSVSFGKKCTLGLQFSVKGKRRHCRILLDRSAPSGRAYVYPDLWVGDKVTIVSEQVDSTKRSVMEMQYLDEVVVNTDRVKADIVLDVERDIASLMDRGEKYPMTVVDYLRDRVIAMNSSEEYNYGKQKTYYCYDYKRPNTLAKIRSEDGSISKWDIEDAYKIKVYYTNETAWNWVISKESRFWRNKPKAPGVLVILIFHDDGLHDEYRHGLRYTFFRGYSQVKEYYHQDNSKKLPGETDFRRTLYWNPNVRTDEAGKAKISFFNNSSCRQMSIDVAGMSEQGKLIIGENE